MTPLDLRDFSIPVSTVRPLTEHPEAPQVLKAMREMGLVQSVKSSRRIEAEKG